MSEFPWFWPIINDDVAPDAAIESHKLAHIPNDPNSVALPLFHIMNQVPSFLNYSGANISASGAVNSAAMNCFLSDMAARGRAECKLPSSEIPLSGSMPLSGSNIRLCGGGDAQTILNFDNVLADGVILSGTNCRIEGIGAIAPNASDKSVFKITGANPTLLSIAVYGGATAMEFTGGTGGIHAHDIRLNNFLHRGIWAHDDVQGLSLSKAEIVAGSHTNGSYGCIMLENFASAVRMANVETLQGVRSLYCNAIGGMGDVTCPAYSTFDGCYFDDAAQGSLIVGCKLLSFGSGWFSGGRSGAGYSCIGLDYNDDITFSATRFMLGGNYNVQHFASNRGMKFVGCTSSDSGYTTHQGRGMSFEQGSHNFQVIGGRMTNGTYSGGHQQFGIVADRCTRYSIIAPDVEGNLIQGLYEYMPPSTGRAIIVV